jgi:pimeloyl-ACP methyl ester carboxylesterase
MLSQSEIDFSAKNFIQIINEDYHYSDTGTGKTILLFLHGYGLSSFSFYKLIENFNHSQYRIITFDLKGNGYSAKPKSSDYTIKKQAELINLFLKKIKINEVNIIGHSYGGLVSLYLNYLQQKEELDFRIKSLVLIDSPAYNTFTPLFIKVLRSKIGSYFFLKIVSPRTLSKMLIRGTFHDKKKGLREYLELYEHFFSQPDYDHTMPQIARQLIPKNIKQVVSSYAKTKIPVLIIWGENDKVVDIKQGKKLHSEIEDSSFKIISNTEHVPHEEKPSEVYKLIKNFYSNG